MSDLRVPVRDQHDARPVWYEFARLRPDDPTLATQECVLRPRPGIEFRIVSAFSAADLDATVGNRFYAVNLNAVGKGAVSQSVFYRAYYHTHLTANQFVSIAHLPNGDNQSWSVTGVPVVGEVIPIPDVWVWDEYEYRFQLGNCPAGSADVYGTNVVYQVRQRDRLV